MSNQKIKINYLYRDASNYKLFASKLFSNTTNLSLDTIKEKIESHLIDSEFFIPENWDFKRLKFDEIDIGEDHDWHEIESIELSTGEVETISGITDLFLKLEFGGKRFINPVGLQIHILHRPCFERSGFGNPDQRGVPTTTATSTR